MKPSEFFIKTRINNQRWCDSDEANESTITELDKRFIDREELKEKITELKVKSKDFECCLEILNELEKILELLK